MDKLPHEYLQSDLKEDIEIRFYIHNKRTFVELRYVSEKKRLYTCSQIIISPDALQLHIVDAEAKLLDVIKKGVK